jgi:hypothetical protein
MTERILKPATVLPTIQIMPQTMIQTCDNATPRQLYATLVGACTENRQFDADAKREKRGFPPILFQTSSFRIRNWAKNSREKDQIEQKALIFQRNEPGFCCLDTLKSRDYGAPVFDKSEGSAQ